MVRKILWGPTLFVAVAVVGWSLSVGEKAAQQAIPPTLIFSSILWFFLVARERHPGLLRGVVVGAVIGLVTQEVPALLEVVFNRAGAYLDPRLQLVVGLWSLLLGGFTGLLAATIQRSLDEAS